MRRYELIGDTLDHVLDGYNIITSHCYGDITLEDRKGHTTNIKTSGNPYIYKVGIYITLHKNVKVSCDTPKVDIVDQLNHIIKRERWMVKATDPTLYKI